jgi:hypothetical protein
VFNVPSVQDFQQVTLPALLLCVWICSELWCGICWYVFDISFRYQSCAFFLFQLIRLTSTSRTTFWSVSATVRSARPLHIFMISEHVDAFRHL